MRAGYELPSAGSRIGITESEIEATRPRVSGEPPRRMAQT